MVNGADEPRQAVRLALQRGTMLIQRLADAEIRWHQDARNIPKRHIQFAEEQDLLQLEQAGLIVIAVAVAASVRRVEQAYGVIVAQRTRGHARQVGQLLDGITRFSLSMPPILHLDVT